MSKENAVDFIAKAATDERLKQQVQAANQPVDIEGIAQEHGFEFSAEHLQAAIPEIKQKRGFFGDIVDAVLALFAPAHDDYPATGESPFSDDPNP